MVSWCYRLFSVFRCTRIEVMLSKYFFPSFRVFNKPVEQPAFFAGAYPWPSPTRADETTPNIRWSPRPSPLLRNRAGSKCNPNLRTPRGQAPGRAIRKNRYSTTFQLFSRSHSTFGRPFAASPRFFVRGRTWTGAQLREEGIRRPKQERFFTIQRINKGEACIGDPGKYRRGRLAFIYAENKYDPIGISSRNRHFAY
jgi:hypothetical protein